MAPRLSKSDKQALIVTHLQATGTCHTLKDLEKTLPSVASINSIQVKEYLQALTDENQIRVEKIGSGNWYWSFGSDERVERERQLARVLTEVEKARKSYTEMGAALAAESTKRKQDEDQAAQFGFVALPNPSTATTTSDSTNSTTNPDSTNPAPIEMETGVPHFSSGSVSEIRQNLMEVRADLEAEVHRLRVAETGGTSVRQKSVLQLRRELAGFRQQSLQWTDNLYVLEQHLRELAGGDQEIVSAVLHECYGDEYVDGGLRELE
ncbi:GAJ protein [Penicillium malachiteum]|uniref:GAJ protein n=1 Tax=Penicillium malachiteum TaxID=1324776 RepID=UPI0025491740|nr:GAJ protein [Penicillium malachiteum]KAJ5721271.1 GAJ protein [Penicillium malachiteum]